VRSFLYRAMKGMVPPSARSSATALTFLTSRESSDAIKPTHRSICSCSMIIEGPAKVGLGRITTKGKGGQSGCESESEHTHSHSVFVARGGVEPPTFGL